MDGVDAPPPPPDFALSPQDPGGPPSAIDPGPLNDPLVEPAPVAMPPPRPDDVYLHHFSFNQDQSCFVASTTRDFRTFTVNPLAEVARRSPKGDGAPVRMVAMLFKTNLFAVVLEESQLCSHQLSPGLNMLLETKTC